MEGILAIICSLTAVIFFTLVYTKLQMDNVGTLANNHSSRCYVRPSRDT